MALPRFLRVLPLTLVPPLAAQDVPLELWTNTTWPGGLVLIGTGACAWSDVDGDGWVDFVGARGGQLWRNLGGVDWELIPDILRPGVRYGSSIGDYNNDGLLDFATEPRAITNEIMFLMKNLDGTSFVDVGDDPNIVDVPPFGDSETNCWIDVDFDGNLDLLVPVYPQWHMGGPGNFFLHNLGPTGPGGAYRFTEMSAAAGLDNPPGTSRPEGAEFCDVDGDGDPDLYSNGTLYQNVSGLGVPMFLDVSDNAGIKFRDILDEGCTFFDHDLDGDFDLVVFYCGLTRTRIYENDGDGTFSLIPKDIIEDLVVSCFAMSKTDWDNDGDIDFTTNEVFRRNMLMETGKRKYVVASHNIPNSDLTNTTATWADWDKDGDVDLLLPDADGGLYDNFTYNDATPLDQRRYVRVKPVRDSDAVPRGLETEYGASVQLFVEDDKPWVRRRSFVSSSAGYLNQNEYALHFALPDDPDPEDPDVDLSFDVSVDFPSDPSGGLRRVDRHVNPVLGGIELARLADREIVVFRGGDVLLGGCLYPPRPGAGRDLTITTGGLVLASDGAPPPDPVNAPAADWYVGHAFDTTTATTPQRLSEVVLDGVTAKTPASCAAGKVRMTLWDTTDAASPFVVPGGEIDVRRYPRNDRNAYRTNWLLEPGRQFRLVARVDELRGTPINGPVVDGPVTTQGGLSFADPTPCEGGDVVAAAVDSQQVYLALRFAEDGGPMWVDLGFAHAGTNGEAQLAGSGAIEPNSQVTLDLTGALPNTLTILVSSPHAACRELAGGILVPETDVLTPLVTDGSGAWSFTSTLPANMPAGATTYFQVWWFDTGAVKLRAASNALSATVPY